MYAPAWGGPTYPHMFWDYSEIFDLYNVYLMKPSLQLSLFLYEYVEFNEDEGILETLLCLFFLIFSFQSQRGSDYSSAPQNPQDCACWFVFALAKKLCLLAGQKHGWRSHRQGFVTGFVRKSFHWSSVGTKQIGFPILKSKVTFVLLHRLQVWKKLNANVKLASVFTFPPGVCVMFTFRFCCNFWITNYKQACKWMFWFQ